MKKNRIPALALAAVMLLGLTACGGGKAAETTAAQTTAAQAAAAETTAAQAQTTAAAKAETTAAAPAKTETTAAAKEEKAGDAGKYVVYEYEAGGQKVSHEMLEMAGAEDISLELKADGTGTFVLLGSELDITWKPGEVTVYGTSKFTYELDGDTLVLDMQGVKYTMVRDGAAAPVTATKPAADAASGDGEAYINDGTVPGVYKVYRFLDFSLAEFAEMTGVTPEEAAEGMVLEIREDGSATMALDGDKTDVDLKIDGEKVTLTAEGETMEGTLKDGLLKLDFEGQEVVLARLTDAAFAAPAEPDKGEAVTWNGLYTKFVGDDDSARDEDGKFSLELYEGGTGVHHRDDMDFKVTWELDGEDFTMKETFIGDPIVYTGTMSGDDLDIFNGDPEDIWSCDYVYVREGGTSSKTGSSSGASSGGSGSAGSAPSGGDGIVSEEKLQKGYVWMNKVAKDIFGTTYEDLVEYFGVEGAFDKEEYSEHMNRNKRYYKWISEDNDTHFIYVNFDEKDAQGAPGVYTISSFNSSGFTASEAEAKYLDAVKAEASAADKAAAADMVMKDFSVDVSPWGSNDDKVTVKMQIPESGWAYDESRDHLVENEDIDAWGAGFIQFKVEEEAGKFDFYKDKFENYKDIDDREIGGVTFRGRTYKNIGYEWTEYIAQLDDAHAVSVGIVGVDVSEGTTGDRILNSITFK